ncbi:MAG: hydrogenase nickel incorporation protein HypB [Promethearchaeota archaeon]
MGNSGEDVPRIVEMNDDLLAQNEALARKNHETFREHDVRTLDVVGAIGAGKTLLLERLVKMLSPRYRVHVVCGDMTTTVDSDRIKEAGATTTQINTGRECALNAYHVHKLLGALPLDELDVVIVENVGNLICPSDFVLGTDQRMVVVSVTEGAHVVRKHPILFKMSDVAVINKVDLLPYLDVDVDEMVGDALKINPALKVITTSAKTGENVESILEALGYNLE